MPETVKGYFLPRKVSTPWPPPTSTIKPPFVTRLLVEAMSLECWAASFWEDSKKRLPRVLNTRIGRVATRMAGLQEKKFRLTSRGEREVMERWDPTDAVKAAVGARFTSALRTILPRYWVTDEMVTKTITEAASLP
jgi:hypothetical protein